MNELSRDFGAHNRSSRYVTCPTCRLQLLGATSCDAVRERIVDLSIHVDTCALSDRIEELDGPCHYVISGIHQQNLCGPSASVSEVWKYRSACQGRRIEIRDG